jgi:hypothetical protein
MTRSWADRLGGSDTMTWALPARKWRLPDPNSRRAGPARFSAGFLGAGHLVAGLRNFCMELAVRAAARPQPAPVHDQDDDALPGEPTRACPLPALIRGRVSIVPGRMAPTAPLAPMRQAPRQCTEPVACPPSGPRRHPPRPVARSGSGPGHEGRHGVARICGAATIGTAVWGGPPDAPRGASPLPGRVNERHEPPPDVVSGCPTAAVTVRGRGVRAGVLPSLADYRGGPRPRRRDRTQKPVSAAAPSAAMASVAASPLCGSCSA